MEQLPATLIEYLELHARSEPTALYSRYLFRDRDPAEVDYGTTLARTREYAALYASAGVKKDAVVLVVLEHHEDLMPAFLGAMWLGALPAFLAYPTVKLDPQRYYKDLRALIDGSKPFAVLTEPPVREVLQATMPPGEGAPVLLVRDDVRPDRQHGAAEPGGAEDVALIQYSSGSTGLRKGVALSHRALLAQIAGNNEFFDMTRADTFCSWVPFYHDWGLVCVALHALVLGTSYTQISPVHWVAQPALGLQAISRYRTTIYYQPNFAFNFMAARVKDWELEGVDLSCLRVCCNGAEPCFYDSHEMFARRFARWGFRREALSIVYGMAELTCSVFAAGPKEPILVDTVDRFLLQNERRAVPVPEDHPNAQRLLGVGGPVRDTEFKIVDDERRELPERRVGEVVIRSRACFHGYHNNPEATAKVLDAEGWYYSRDMGYRVGHRLVIAGRKSDLIIVAGTNIYPQDVEAIASEHPEVVPGRVVAIGVDDPAAGTQKIVLIVESRTSDPAVRADIAQYVRAQVAQRLQVVLSRVYHAPHMWLIKTSSGKIARIPNYSRVSELE